MKNSRNTLLFIAGTAHIVKSIVSAILLILVSLCIEIIDVSLKIVIFRSKLYSYSPELGEKLLTFIIVAIFVYLSLNIFLSFGMGLLCLDQSKLGAKPLTNRGVIVVLSVINCILLNGIIFNALAISSLIIDKHQTESAENEIASEQLRVKICELKKLKDDKVITQKEFIEMVTKVLVE